MSRLFSHLRAHEPMRRARPSLLILGLLAPLLLSGPAALAQSWPQRTVKFLLPLGPVFPNNPFNQNFAFVHDGGEIIYSLPNGLQAYYLINETGYWVTPPSADLQKPHSLSPRPL